MKKRTESSDGNDNTTDHSNDQDSDKKRSANDADLYSTPDHLKV